LREPPWLVTQSTVSDQPDQYAGPPQRVWVSRNELLSSRTHIVAVDYFIDRAISGAYELVCRSALGHKRHQPPPEEDYGSGDARWSGHVPRRTIDRSNKREPGAPALRKRLDDVIPATTSPCYKEAAARGFAAASISRKS
jgi:hypothetical protein